MVIHRHDDNDECYAICGSDPHKNFPTNRRVSKRQKKKQQQCNNVKNGVIVQAAHSEQQQQPRKHVRFSENANQVLAPAPEDEPPRTPEELEACFYSPEEYQRICDDDEFLMHMYLLHVKHNIEWHDEAYVQNCIRGLEKLVDDDAGMGGDGSEGHCHHKKHRKFHSDLVLLTQDNLRIAGLSRDDVAVCLRDVAEWSSYDSKLEAWKLAEADAAACVALLKEEAHPRMIMSRDQCVACKKPGNKGDDEDDLGLVVEGDDFLDGQPKQQQQQQQQDPPHHHCYHHGQ